MKRKSIWFAAFAFVVVAYAAMAFNLLAQTNGIPSGDGTNAPPVTGPDATPIESAGDLLNGLLLLAIPVVTPMIVRLGKTFMPFIPGWTLPIIAPVLVALVNWLLSASGGPSINPLLALLLGSAGVGFREVKDQVQQRITEGPKPEDSTGSGVRKEAQRNPQRDPNY